MCLGTSASSSAVYTTQSLAASNVDTPMDRSERLVRVCDEQAATFRKSKSSARGPGGMLTAMKDVFMGKLFGGGGTAPAPASSMQYECDCGSASPDLNESKKKSAGANRRKEEKVHAECYTTNMECDDEDEGGVDATAPPPPPAPAMAPAAPAPSNPKDVLQLLNKLRTVEGYFPRSDLLLQAVGKEAGAAAPDLLAAACRPAGVSDDAWCTVLALAYLRKHLAAESGVWEGMEAKALEWLAAGAWPAEAGRSVGGVILAACKLV